MMILMIFMVAKGCLVVDMCTCGQHVNTLHTKTKIVQVGLNHSL